MVGASFDSKTTVDVFLLNLTDLRSGWSVGLSVLECPDEGLRADFGSCLVRGLGLDSALDLGLDRDLCLEVRVGSSRLLDDLCLCLCLCLCLGLVVRCTAGGLPALLDHLGGFLAVFLPPLIHPGVFDFLLASSAGIFVALSSHLVLRLHFPLWRQRLSAFFLLLLSGVSLRLLLLVSPIVSFRFQLNHHR